MRPWSRLRWLVPAFWLTTTLVACDASTLTDPASPTGTEPSVDLGVELHEPESVGMSTAGLARLKGGMQELINQGRLAGMTTMLARHGKIVHFATYGARDREAGRAMPPDAIFRIYSMTKPIIGVGLMTLYEEGRFQLSDPVAMYIPEFADLEVASGVGASGPLVEEADHLMTIRELMTHTAGLTYGVFSNSQVDAIYRDVDVLDRGGTLSDMITKLSHIPLWGQPGAQWHYSVAVDVQGYLIEVLSGQPLDTFLQDRVLGPLGMVDSGFHVHADKADRFTQVYTYDLLGNLTVGETASRASEWKRPATFFSGGGGFVSTTLDYMRFCLMLLNDGELDGVRVLSQETVSLMRSDHLPAGVSFSGGREGFGLDFAVVLDPSQGDGVSAGTYYWGGAAGTWFWIDPKEDLAFVGMIQQFGNRPDVRGSSRQYVYDAITVRAN